VRTIAAVRRRSFKPKQTPQGYLLNDGTVLAIEVARVLPDAPVGRVSLAGPESPADHVVEVHSDMGREALYWEYALDGEPVDEQGRPVGRRICFEVSRESLAPRPP
jgi:hypothetical protein